VIRGGVRVLCAGSLAVRYQELGGRCAIQLASRIRQSTNPCCKASGCPLVGVAGGRRCAAHRHSRGPRAVDIASCWVLSGIHGEALANGFRRL